MRFRTASSGRCGSPAKTGLRQTRRSCTSSPTPSIRPQPGRRSNPEAAAAVLRKYMKVTYSRAHEYHARSLDPDMIQPMLDAALHYKLLTTPVTADELIWKG